MKRKYIIALVLLMALVLAPAVIFANTTKAPQVEARALKDGLPIQVVKETEFPTYEYDGEDVFDFRKYFDVMDQSVDILRMNNLVDGINDPIDLGGYVWDFGGFNTQNVGTYTIKITYVGVSGISVSASEDIFVIEEDTQAPTLYGFSATRVLSKGSSFENFIKNLSASDNVDGEIILTLDNFSGHEGIETADLETTHIVITTVTDKAGNTRTHEMTIIIRDTSAPVIIGLTRNVETTVNKPVDYKAQLSFVDNNDTLDEITIEYEGEPDFTKAGIYNIRVTATDQSGNYYSGTYNVIVKDPISLTQIILVINGFALVAAAITVVAVIIFKKRQVEVVETNEN